LSHLLSNTRRRITFRHTLGTAKFSGNLLREGPHEGFVEIFGEESKSSGILGVDEGTASPKLAESSIEAGSTDAFNVTITLSFFDT
jgi:hypothetical protein